MRWMSGALRLLSENRYLGPVDGYLKLVEFVSALENSSRKIKADARRYLAWVSELSVQKAYNKAMDDIRLYGSPDLRPTPTTFELFPLLPTELRLMIFTAAAQPPSCPHYFETFDPKLGGREPSAEFMVDHGLWTACKESRQSVQTQYRKAAARVTSDYHSACHFQTQEGVRLHLQLGYLNPGVVELFRRSSTIPWQDKFACQVLSHELHVLLIDQPHMTAEMVEAASQEYAPHWAEDDDRPSPEMMWRIRDHIISGQASLPDVFLQEIPRFD
ncbi:hypothetical protein SEPCBS57363_003971 [Sporothrix epigloea]|uniref:2EXR domain-containing protein n=1 Tax=Sporothrix epigloea TaxID=1892477 RepID=A0ABP0DQT4_9PEZI